MNEGLIALLTVVVSIVGIVAVALFLGFLIPSKVARIRELEGVGRYVCVEEYDWFRKDYNKQCKFWSEVER